MERKTRKTFYSDYVGHCMRFYSRYQNPNFKNTVELSNWQACEAALRNFRRDEVEILTDIYKSRNPITESISRISEMKGIKVDNVWEMLTRLEYDVAYLRGLI